MSKKNGRNEVFVRLPLSGTHKAVTEGNFLYVQGIDVERIKSTIGLYERPLPSDRKTGWLRHTANETLSQAPAFTKDDLENLIQSSLGQLRDAYPIIDTHPVLKGLVNSIYSQAEIIISARDCNLDSVEDNLQQYTYGIMSGLAKTIDLILELEKTQKLTHSLAYSFEQQDEQGKKFLMICAEALQSYFSAITDLVDFVENVKTNLVGLSRETDSLVQRKMNLRVIEEGLEEEVAECILSDYDSDKHKVVSQKISDLMQQIEEYNAEQLIMLEIGDDAKKQLSTVTDLIKKAAKAHDVLKTYQDQEDFSKLYLEEWVSPETYKQVETWLAGDFHKAKVWDEQLVGVQNMVRAKLNLISNKYDSSQVEAWQTSLPLPKSKAVSVPVSIPRNIKDGAVADSYRSFQGVGVPAHATDSSRVCPTSMADMKELLILSAAARTNSLNYLWSLTFKSMFEVLQIAGFDLHLIDQALFRKYIREHPKVEDVNDCKKVKQRQPSSKRELLIFTVPKGTNASKVRLKITQYLAEQESVMQSLEQKWGITRIEIKQFAKERNEANEQKK